MSFVQWKRGFTFYDRPRAIGGLRSSCGFCQHLDVTKLGKCWYHFSIEVWVYDCMLACTSLFAQVCNLHTFIDCIWLTKFFVLGSAKEPNRWYPAIPRAIQRKAHIRERRYKKHATRLLARCLKQTHKSHGPFVAWLFKPVVYPSLFVLPRSIQRVASSDRLSSGTTMMVTY